MFKANFKISFNLMLVVVLAWIAFMLTVYVMTEHWEWIPREGNVLRVDDGQHVLYTQKAVFCYHTHLLHVFTMTEPSLCVVISEPYFVEEIPDKKQVESPIPEPVSTPKPETRRIQPTETEAQE